MLPRLFIAKFSPAKISPEFVNAVIVPVVSLNSPKLSTADILPELVIVPIVPLFLNPLLVPAEIIPVPVFINDVMVEEESKLCKPNFATAVILPEFVIVPTVPLFPDYFLQKLFQFQYLLTMLWYLHFAVQSLNQQK